MGNIFRSWRENVSIYRSNEVRNVSSSSLVNRYSTQASVRIGTKCDISTRTIFNCKRMDGPTAKANKIAFCR